MVERKQKDEKLGEGLYPHQELTEKVIGCAISVHRALGPGYLENIYENALAHELQKQKIPFERQKVINVLYDGVKVGEHRLDLLVAGEVLIELKSVEQLSPKHTAQIISTLKAASVKIGLLINFNERKLIDGLRRIAF